MTPLRPSKIIGIGRNYVAHAQELGNPMPAVPIVFLKPPTSLIGDGDTIRLPSVSRRVEFEAEIDWPKKRTLVLCAAPLCAADGARLGSVAVIREKVRIPPDTFEDVVGSLQGSLQGSGEGQSRDSSVTVP